MTCLRALLSGLILTLALPLCAAGQQQDTPLPVAIDSQEYQLLQAFHAGSPGSINHLGLIAEQDRRGYRVSTVLDGFPAQQAGLRRGDLLLSIDGQAYHPLRSLNPRSTDGSYQPVTRPVELEYDRDGTVMTATLLPSYGNLFDAYRTATSASAQQFSNGNKLIGYVKLWALDRSTHGITAFNRLLDSLSHCDGLIIDLRDSYGFISASHIDRFFSSRNSFFTIEGENSDLWQTQQPPRALLPEYGRAMVVIQNAGTRGGMELFAYQLAKLQRVTSVGETTAGMAGQVSYNTVENALTYHPDPEILIDGRRLEAAGVDAEVQVPYPLGESLAVDPQLDAALLALMEII
jgi:carboxyl-terminal processing protease